MPRLRRVLLRWAGRLVRLVRYFGRSVFGLFLRVDYSARLLSASVSIFRVRGRWFSLF